jgi:hypothetical protein
MTDLDKIELAEARQHLDDAILSIKAVLPHVFGSRKLGLTIYALILNKIKGVLGNLEWLISSGRKRRLAKLTRLSIRSPGLPLIH